MIRKNKKLYHRFDKMFTRVLNKPESFKHFYEKKCHMILIFLL